VCTGNFSFKICGVVLWRGSVRNIILLHTHTHTILSQNFTKNFFFSSHHSQFTRDILTASPSRTDNNQTLLSAVPVYRLAPSFPIYISGGVLKKFKYGWYVGLTKRTDCLSKWNFPLILVRICDNWHLK